MLILVKEWPVAMLKSMLKNKLWELEGYRLFTAQVQQNEKYCSDERPCVNCFADQGKCLDSPI